MMFLCYLYIFLLGTIVGSFLNVVIDRLPKGSSLIKRRSHCDHCQHALSWMDLIPIVSFLLLRGKCRYCKTPVSLYYPVVEGITGVSFVLTAFFIFGYNPLLHITDLRLFIALLYFWCIMASMIAIFFTDLKYGIIPFKVVVFALVVTLLWYVFFPFLHFALYELSFIDIRDNYIVNYLLSALGAFVFFLALFLATKGRGLGFGDVIFVFLMGLLLGFPKIILALYIAFLSGAVIALLLIIVGRKKLKRSTIPFGPFLVLGTVISLFWGQYLINRILLLLLGY